MPQLSMRDAINQALHQEMARDERIIVLGEDVSGGAGGSSGEREASGGIFGVTKGLLPRFGADRVIDTPISESAIVGAAAGAALAGLRPVAEIMFADFVGVCMDQLYNQIAKFRYMFGGRTACPVVIRMAMGAGMNMGAQHSQSIYALMTAVPGLKIVVPSNAYDAKGLLIQAIRDDDPVVFFEHKALYPRKSEVPEEPYALAFGQANVVREGDDATVVALGRMVPFAEKALDALAREGIRCDLIDLRTTSPLDEEVILESVTNTGRLVVVDESPPRCSIAADIAALAASHAFSSLRAPVMQVTAPHAPVPFAPALERAWVPGPQKIEAAIRQVLEKPTRQVMEKH
ncbi:MAG: alpha-ketoacid dehydrogenase subunit beta [Sinobacteraceae bacterium]|nr:alpha-ketoacid dehydrogenase subunit beta [Nevskiaceae bacterium]